MTKKIICVLAFLFLSQMALAQDLSQLMKYRREPKGDEIFTKRGLLDGNMVRTYFWNHGEIAKWRVSPAGEWPKGSGVDNLDGVCVLVASEIKAPGGQTIHPLQTNYREWMDKDPLNGTIWGFEPIPGYADSSSTLPSISTNPRTWPKAWSRALPIDPTWDGYWYGYFGKGVKNADQETFYAMDDSKDGEWARQPYNYYPIKSDSAFGGIGLHVEVRGFQWSHVLAEDIIFWHYDIFNISDEDHDKTFFGFYTDVGSGGETSAGDNAFYDTKLDLAYGWDNTGHMTDGRPIGYTGWAYLESPGNSFNGVDDDQDGLIDEKRDSGPGTFSVGPIGTYGDPKGHWSGDENGDWISYFDMNENGKWDPQTEPLNDDVGKDGLGVYDEGYPGPDEGEGDGKPTDGEPHFDKTDKNESDQIGLSALSIYILGDGGVGGGWPKDDESMWLKLSSQIFDTQIQNKNISMVFSSGPFPLKQAYRERFSMALLFGSDLEDLVFNKRTVQEVYNANYNFSKPPIKPIATVVPGDRRVFLYWDKRAEESRDPFMGYEQNNPSLGAKKDFEGYLIYRSTEPEFNDIKVITDSKGASKYWKPIAQFDLVDKIKDPDPVGINGARFWRGSDNGLQHSFIDTNVVNGQRYYYAVVSYDMGDPNKGTAGLQPSECTKIISEDYSGTINFIDVNCAVVTPNAPVAGYMPPSVVGNLNKVSTGIGTGKMSLNVLNPGVIKEGATYKVKFNSTGKIPKYATSSFDIIRTYKGVTDTLLTQLDTTVIGPNRFSPPFDGMTVSVLNDTLALVDTATHWLNGARSNISMAVIKDPDAKYGVLWPCDYRIEFLAGKTVPTLSASLPYNGTPVNFIVINTTRNDTVAVYVYDNDGDGTFNVGDDFTILEFQDKNNNHVNDLSERNYVWKVAYRTRPNETAVEPLAGDKFVITSTKPYNQDDSFTFITKASSVDAQLAGDQLGNISVVPNPYISVASWEPRTLNMSGRGERKIDFTHLPALCTVRIYTIAGALVKTLQKDTGADGSMSWNLLSDDGMEIAYGVYVYHVDAPGIGEHVGKFAVIK